MFGNSRYSRQGRNRQNQIQLTDRTKLTFRIAVAVAAICGIALFVSIIATSPIWGTEFPQDTATASQQGQTPKGTGGAFNGIEKYLALLAAACTVLAIIIPNQSMPKIYMANAVTGGLSAFGAVSGTFNPSSVWDGLIILAISSPVLIATTVTWRLPKSFWECIVWILIISIIVLLMVAIIINTKIGLLMIIVLGADAVRAILMIIVGIAGTFLIFAWITLVAKAGVMMQQNNN